MATVLFETLQHLRKDKNLVVYDTHIHPHEVMGIAGSDHDLSKIKPIDYKKASLAETLKLGRIVNIILGIIFKVSPTIVKISIKSMYAKIGVTRLLEEMNHAGIDNGVLVPVEPWSNTEKIYNNFQNNRFLFLGSIDLHNNSLKNIEEKLNYFLTLNIVGLKLHPNLQGFYPQPKDNDEEVGKKLNLIYSFTQRHNLYILFHGGYTRFTRIVDKNPDIQKVSSLRGHDYALLEKFCDVNGKSEIFENYNFPVIIAHLGNYGLVKPDLKIFKVIINKFKNVFFDTAGVSPNLIRSGLEIAGSHRIVFGSDVQYYSLFYSVQFCLEAIDKSKTGENKKDMLINVFSKNFQGIINV